MLESYIFKHLQYIKNPHMSACPHCRQHGEPSVEQKERPKSIYKWFGFYTLCNKCNRLYFRRWNVRSMTIIVMTVIALQFLASLLVLPALNHLVANDVLRIVIFTVFHLAFLPIYTLTSISLMLNAR